MAKRTAGRRADQDRVSYLEEELERIHAEIEEAKATTPRPWTALSKLRTLALKCRSELDEARPPKRFGDLTTEELVERLARGIAAVPPEHLGPLEEALAARRVH